MLTFCGNTGHRTLCTWGSYKEATIGRAWRHGVDVAANRLVTGLKWKASARAEATELWRWMAAPWIYLFRSLSVLWTCDWA